MEGVGLKRLTANFLQALPFLDGAFRASDQEAVTMARYLMQVSYRLSPPVVERDACICVWGDDLVQRGVGVPGKGVFLLFSCPSVLCVRGREV